MESKELKVKAELASGVKPRILADKYDVAYSTVIKYRNEMRVEAEKAKVAKVVNLDPVALQVVVENIEEAEREVGAISVDTNAVVKGAQGLQKLEPKFQSAVEKLLERAVDLADDENLTPTGLNTLAKAVGSLYSDIYSSKGTNVQINNTTNTVSADGMSQFEASQR